MEYLVSKNKKDSFAQEMVWILYILIMTFMPQLHLLASETLLSFEILGFEYKHHFLSNQAFFYFLLRDLQLFAFLLLTLRYSNAQVGYILLFPIYWVLNELFWIILPWEVWNAHKVFFEVSSIFIALCISLGQIMLNSKNALSTISIKILSIFLGVVFIGFPLIINKLYNVPGTIQKMDFLGVTITADSFAGVPSFLIILFYKLLLLSTLILSFFKVKRWWRYTFFVPVLMATFQIYSIIFVDSDVMDEQEFFQALPLLFLVSILLLFLSRSAYYNSLLKRLYQNTVSQIEENKESLSDQKLNYLRQKWKDITRFKSNDASVSELKNLRKELERQLEEY